MRDRLINNKFIAELKNKLKSDDKKITIIIIVAIVLGAFILLLSIYSPMMKKKDIMARRLQELKQKLKSVSNVVQSKDSLRRKGSLLTRKEISLAIDEMTSAGRQFNINFISISPQEIEKVTATEYKQLPIIMELESSYKDIGLFFGSPGEIKDRYNID